VHSCILYSETLKVQLFDLEKNSNKSVANIKVQNDNNLRYFVTTFKKDLQIMNRKYYVTDINLIQNVSMNVKFMK
jgi:uncharacterized protein YlaN (UPF0358 family)